jgi:hypothetical protein
MTRTRRPSLADAPEPDSDPNAWQRLRVVVLGLLLCALVVATAAGKDGAAQDAERVRGRHGAVRTDGPERNLQTSGPTGVASELLSAGAAVFSKLDLTGVDDAASCDCSAPTSCESEPEASEVEDDDDALASRFPGGGFGGLSRREWGAWVRKRECATLLENGSSR